MIVCTHAGLSPSMHRVSNGSVASGDSRRNSMVDACGRFCSQPTNGAPELLIALCYDTDHGCLTVGIERGSSLGEKSRPPDTFIKIVALGEFGNELWRQKTELVKGSAEPQYDHSASIQLHRPDLDVCTVRIEVWSSVGVLRRRQLLGWLALGLNSSSPDAQEHWEQMIQFDQMFTLHSVGKLSRFSGRMRRILIKAKK
ncbi:C2 domain protein [Ancylostoma ceylanicum]|uniref:C2 domain protein n=1 Tax=Ancylostoma ceylanicum TaxID=53326 RepID=A0A0D6M3J3_9BILA|nr:C2 domain protein [Ancylostoma ceylanicum]